MRGVEVGWSKLKWVEVGFILIREVEVDWSGLKWNGRGKLSFIPPNKQSLSDDKKIVEVGCQGNFTTFCYIV